MPGWVGALVWVWCGAPARAGSYTFRVWPASEGLPQASVRALAQDGAGYVWVGTQAGLSRFDGERFVPSAVADGLPSDHVNDLLWDGELWVATLGGVARRDGERFVAAPLPDWSGATDVLALAPRAEGGLWCGTDAGLLSYDDGQFAWAPWPEVRHVIVRAVTADGNRVAAASPDGLFVADDAGAGWIPALRMPWTGVDIAVNGRVWAAGDAGVAEVDGHRVVRRWGDAEGLPTDLWTVNAARDGSVWLSARAGVARIADGRLMTVDEAHGLPLSGVSEAMEDADGLLWFGGYGGVAQLASLAFTTFTRADGLAANSVRPIVRTRDGVLWVGTTGGLSALTAAGWQTYTAADGLSAANILTLAEGPRGELWVGTSSGVDVFDGRTFEHRLDQPVGRIVFERTGRMWLIHELYGPMVSADGVTFERVDVPGQAWSSRSRIVVAGDGTVWASGSRGLSAFDGYKWRTYTIADGLAGDDVYFLADDGRGTLWFGYDSSRGLTRYDGRTFRTFTTADGLQSNSVYSIGCDQRGNVWVGTSRGLDRFDGRNFRPYGPEEGYASLESNSHGFWEDDDGVLWFGTFDGLSRYDPSMDRPLPGEPRVFLEEVSLDGRPAMERVEWPADLSARVNVRSYTPPGRNEVQVRLLGRSDDWRPVVGEITEEDLRPGRYTLQVRARRYGGEWSRVATASWTIVLPLWRDPWVAGGATAATGVVLWGIVRARLRRSERANAALQDLVRETQRAETAARQANEAKGTFLATMSHELRTPLNAIIGYAEMLGEEVQGDAAQADVERIRSAARHLLAILADVLDLSRIEAGKIEVVNRPFAVGSVVREAADTVSVLAGEIRFDVNDTCPDAEVHADPGRLRQVLVNLLTNAFKFTDAGHVSLTVRLRPDDEDRVWFEVADSGIGIPADQLERLFEPFVQLDGSSTRKVGGVGLGLAICRELVHRMGGGIEVASAPGEGSTFSVWLRRVGAA